MGIISKSRFCPSCGKKYSALWAEKTSGSILQAEELSTTRHPFDAAIGANFLLIVS